MKTRTLLTMVFGVLMALPIGRAVLSLTELNRASAGFDSYLERDRLIGATLARVGMVTLDLEAGVHGWLLTSDPAFLEPYRRAARQRASSLDDLERAVEMDAHQVELARRLRTELEGWESQVARPLTAPGVFARPASERLALSYEGKARMDDIRSTLDAVGSWLGTRRASEVALVTSYRDRIAAESWGLTFLVEALLAVLALVTVRFIERPFGRLLAYANQMARGEVGTLHEDGVGEIRALGAAMKKMAVRMADERERERRFTELITALSAGGTLATVAGTALHLLVTHQRATAGVLWVAAREPTQNDGGPLELAASQAVDTGALPRGGDALAREVRASGEARFLDELPKDAALIVRTAFVDAIPKAMVVAPVCAGSDVVGVVELAGKISEADLPELERSLERVGLALQNAMAGERLAALGSKLAGANERLQGQNEELRVQDEELRARGEELVDRNRLLARASQRKSDFLSSMSHELRTPLNAVIGLADVLLAGTYGEMPEAQRHAITDIRGAGKQLLTLVNDSLDLSKIEAGRLEVHAERVDIAEPAREACALVGALAMRKRIRVHNEITAGSFACRADRDRTRQVLANLLSNAVKFTPDGGSVTLSAKGGGSFVRVNVADTGIGIAPSDMSRLFLPFSQLETTRAGGTGLGLSISKRLVELMGGEIGVVSEPQKGSLFFFTLPILQATLSLEQSGWTSGVASSEASNGAAQPASDAASSPAQPAGARPGAQWPLANRRVLVIDDNEVSRRVVKGVLTSAGYDVFEADDAQTGFALARRDRPGVVIIDVRMPRLDGLTVTSALELEADGWDVAVIATGSQATGDDRKRAKAAGCVAFLNKPIARQELLRAIDGACGGAARSVS